MPALLLLSLSLFASLPYGLFTGRTTIALCVLFETLRGRRALHSICGLCDTPGMVLGFRLCLHGRVFHLSTSLPPSLQLHDSHFPEGVFFSRAHSHGPVCPGSYSLSDTFPYSSLVSPVPVSDLHGLGALFLFLAHYLGPRDVRCGERYPPSGSKVCHNFSFLIALTISQIPAHSIICDG